MPCSITRWLRLLTLVSCVTTPGCKTADNPKSGCESTCMLLEACKGPLQDGLDKCIQSCEETRTQVAADQGDECAEKHEALDLCIGELSCSEYDAFVADPDAASGPCAGEIAAGKVACQGG